MLFKVSITVHFLRARKRWFYTCNCSTEATYFSFAVVPEYDVTTPYQLNENFKRRRRRAEESRENIFYKVKAFGRELHLNLTLNKKLMSPDLVAETIYADGTISYSPPPPNNYYLGNVMSDPYSMVAVSDNGGLVN